MEPTKLEYLIEITKSGDGAEAAASEFQQLAIVTSKAGDSIKSHVADVQNFIAALGKTDFIKQAVEQFKLCENAVQRLNDSLRSSEQSKDGYVQQLKEIASLSLKVHAELNALFGPQAITNASDMAAAVGLLTEKYTGLLKVAGVFVAGLMAFQIGKQAWLLGKDLDGETEAVKRSRESHARLSEMLRAEIAERVKLNALTAEEAARLNALIRPGADLGPVSAALRPPGQAAKADGDDRLRDLDPVTAGRQLQDVQRGLQVASARNYGSEIFVPGMKMERKTSGEILAEQLETQLAKIEEQRQKGLINDQQYFDTRKQLEHDNQIALAEVGRQGEEAQRELGRSRGDRYAAEQEQVAEHFKHLEDVISAYYDVLFQRRAERGGEGMGDDLQQILQDKRAALDDVAVKAQQANYEAGFLGKTLVNVGTVGAQSFSSGMAGAMVSFISGTKSAKEAFSQFAVSFMQQIAQMILQALILRAIQGVFGAMAGGSGAATSATTPGWGTAVGAGVMAAAEGGLIPRKMAAGGLQSVSTATYFPQFNAIAGEAGREVLAVLSRPRMMDLGGLSAYVGQVQGQDMAMTDARGLQSAIGNRQSAIAGGRIEIAITMSPEVEARVLRNSVEQAVVEINTALSIDSPTSAAVKSLTA